MAATNKPRIIEHVQQSLTWTCYDVKWIPSSARCVAVGSYARGTGTMQVFSLDQGQKLVKAQELETKHPVKCCTFEASTLQERHLACGDFEGNLKLYDLEKNKALFDVKAHKTIINTLDGAGMKHGPPEIATGSRDGCVKIWDIRQKQKPVVSLEPEESEKVPDCWSVAFGNSYNDAERVVVAGYDNGDLKMFDLRMNTLRFETNVKNGICSLEFDRKETQMNKLLVTTLEGRFLVYDLFCYNAEKGYAGASEKMAQNSTVWCGKHLPQNRDLFFVGSGSGLVSLYKYNYPSQRSINNPPEGVAGKLELLAKHNISSQPVSAMDWNRSKEGLAVMSAFDQAIRIVLVTKLHKI